MLWRGFIAVHTLMNKATRSSCSPLNARYLPEHRASLTYYRLAMHVELFHGSPFCVTIKCSFDEPALKATFASTLIIPSHLTALSNMPIISEKPFTDGSKKGKGPISEDLKRVEFETTPIMSTYVPTVNPVLTDDSFWRMQLASSSILKHLQRLHGTTENAFLFECTRPRDLFRKANLDWRMRSRLWIISVRCLILSICFPSAISWRCMNSVMELWRIGD